MRGCSGATGENVIAEVESALSRNLNWMQVALAGVIFGIFWSDAIDVRSRTVLCSASGRCTHVGGAIRAVSTRIAEIRGADRRS